MLSATLAGCYDQLPTPTAPTTEATEAPPERPIQPSVAGTGKLGENLAALTGVIEKLGRGSGTRGPEERPGSARWRPAELEKLSELTGSICATGVAGCREALNKLTEANLPTDELRGVLGLFLGPLRPQAEIGFAVLGAYLFGAPDMLSRDLAFRMAVAAGVTRRGEPDTANRRATLVPQSPVAGSAAVLLVELPSPCQKLDTEHKGPDIHGRVDLRIEPNCAGEPDPELGPEGFPQPARAVWSMAIPEMPSAGLSVWAYGAEAPLLDYRVVVPPEPIKE